MSKVLSYSKQLHKKILIHILHFVRDNYRLDSHCVHSKWTIIPGADKSVVIANRR
jgi:hypothetical protein